MPWLNYCPVCESLVTPPHPHTDAFSFHFRGSKKPATPETLEALGRVMQAARLHAVPWLNPGWSTEADEPQKGEEL
jgi:hypothetical protein